MLLYNEDQLMLRDSASKFLAAQVPVSQLRKLRDERSVQGYDLNTWAEITEQGWLGVLISEQCGGIDFGFVGATILCEEMGRTLAASPFISSSMGAAVALREAGASEYLDQWLTKIADGTGKVVLAVDEKSKHLGPSVSLSATKQGSNWSLTGEKAFVADGLGADAFIVAAQTSEPAGDASGISLFIVEASDPGVSVVRVPTLDSRNVALVCLNNACVTGEQLVGKLGFGAEILDRALDAVRIGLAAEMSGIAQEVFGRTVEYLKVRKQFGRVVASFQAIQHRLAHIYCEIEVLKSVVLAAAQAADSNIEAAKTLVCAAKVKAEKVAQLAVVEAIQLHGGIGMTDELDLGLFIKRVRAASEQGGDRYFHADRFARLRGF